MLLTSAWRCSSSISAPLVWAAPLSRLSTGQLSPSFTRHSLLFDILSSHRSRSRSIRAAVSAALAALVCGLSTAETSDGSRAPLGSSSVSLGMLGPVLAGVGGTGNTYPRPVARSGSSGRRDEPPLGADGRHDQTPSNERHNGGDDIDQSGNPPNLFVKELGLQLTVGTICGFCSGYALKKVSKAAAIAIGIGFIAVQLARHNGLISDVDWAALEARLVAAWDTDGDGHVSAQGGSDAPRVPCILIWRAWNTTTLNRCLADLHAHAQRAIDILGFNLPSGAAFAAAFIAGLRAG